MPQAGTVTNDDGTTTKTELIQNSDGSITVRKTTTTPAANSGVAYNQMAFSPYSGGMMNSMMSPGMMFNPIMGGGMFAMNPMMGMLSMCMPMMMGGGMFGLSGCGGYYPSGGSGGGMSDGMGLMLGGGLAAAGGALIAGNSDSTFGKVAGGILGFGGLAMMGIGLGQEIFG